MTKVELTATTPLRELQVYVAEHLWIPCDCNDGIRLTENNKQFFCPQCGKGIAVGSGQVWPMRKPCTASPYPNACKRRGWIPVTDRNQLEEAVRAKGWNYSHGDAYSGDWAYIEDGSHNQRASIIGEVKGAEQLRGDAAVWLAAARAIQAVGGELP